MDDGDHGIGGGRFRWSVFQYSLIPSVSFSAEHHPPR